MLWGGTEWKCIINKYLYQVGSETLNNFEELHVNKIISRDNCLKIKYAVSKIADGKIIEYNA